MVATAYLRSSLGSYRVTLKRADGTTAVRDVLVNVGTGTPVSFVAAAGTTEMGTVNVVGARAVNPIDVSSVASTSILTAEQIAKIPVPRDATSVALLAPGTVRGDTAFGNLASLRSAALRSPRTSTTSTASTSPTRSAA
ncbi:hypothetical protein H1235_01545 [Pseudoxanthomonas sp. NC8]|nr:hypothetical protein H1235_01545 [Pseudoxanthomonas sp. NC8]